MKMNGKIIAFAGRIKGLLLGLQVHLRMTWYFKESFEGIIMCFCLVILNLAVSETAQSFDQDAIFPSVFDKRKKETREQRM